jgi:hypothetical protein
MVLLLNAVAILSEDRFLARGRWHPDLRSSLFGSDISLVGWSRNQREAGFGQQDSSVKVRIGELIAGVRLVTRGKFENSCTGLVDVRAEIGYFEAPLIVANAAIITYELLLG